MNPNPGVAVLALLLALNAAGKACWASDQLVRFDVPDGHAATTLRQFAAQCNMNVLFQRDEVDTRRTHAISGSFAPLEALRLMLRGTGLNYRFREPDSVVVFAPGRPLHSSGGSCKRTGSKLCGADPSDGGEDASTVTVTAGAGTNNAPSDSGQPPPRAPQITLARQYLMAGGFQTVGEALRNLPQNFGGGLNVGVLFAGGGQNVTSQSSASTVNLRGLGSDSTLVLVNGLRLTGSEGTGAVDVTLIPISAVERIEITTGGASAQYGSDAVAGVVNIVTRTDVQGVELSSALGFAMEGGGFLQHYSVVAGDAYRGAHVTAIVDCAVEQEIDSQQRKYIPTDISGTTLMPGMKRCSELFSASRPLADALELNLFGAFTRRSARRAVSLTLAPSSTASPSTTTSFPRADVDQYAINAVLKQHFLQSWTATVSGGLSADDIGGRERVTQTGAPDQRYDNLVDNRLWTGQIIVSGDLAKTPAGPVQLTVGAGYNQQDFALTDVAADTVIPGHRRRIRFAFAQSAIPLLPSPADANDSAALSLNLAIRGEQYSEVGGTTNSSVDLTYKPIQSVKVRASWGTSFRAPTLLQQFDTQQAVLEFVPDGAQPGGQSLALLRFGGNTLLRAETSTDTALDLTLTPEALPGALLQIDYFNILYRQRIQNPTLNTGDPLSDPNIWPFVTRTPSSASVTQILQQSQVFDLSAGQFATQGAAEVIDDRVQNWGRQTVSGVDFLWQYKRDSAFGKWDTSLNTAYLDLRQQVADGAATVPLSGTVFYPPVLRGRFGVSWSYSTYLGSLFVNYTGRSRTVSSPKQQLPEQPIASWTTLDGQAGMTFDDWGKTTLILSAENLLDRHPPLYNSRQPGMPSVNYDSTNTSPVGRFLTLQLTQRW